MGEKINILPLPEDQMPKCWWNHDEISYYFSPFRSVTQNPLDKESKLKFWKPMIRLWCNHHKRCTFSVSVLEKAFQKDVLVPACIPEVITEMLRIGELRLKSDFMQVPSESWSGWVFNALVKKPVAWSWKKAVNIAIAAKAEGEFHYVLDEAAKSHADDLLSKVQVNEKGGLLLSLQELKELSGCPLEDLEVVIHLLSCKKKVSVFKDATGTLVKFARPNEHATTITEADRGVHALRLSERTLTRHLEELEAERLQAMETARGYLAKGMRQMAKSSLRKKHELEKCIEKRATTLSNVQVLLTRVREAENDSKILESYQVGVSALKQTFKEAELTEDSASNVMLQVEEILDVQDEIQSSLAQGVSSAADEELEDELAELLLADSNKNTSQNTLIADLPSPPMTELSPRVKIPDPPTRQLAL